MSIHIARSANVQNIVFGAFFAARSDRSKFRRNISINPFQEIKGYLDNMLLPRGAQRQVLSGTKFTQLRL
jgi:hypothetical protein